MDNTINVLFIEDNPPDIRLVHELLKEAKQDQFLLVNKGTLSVSLDMLAKQPFDVILLDLGLPDSQGIDTFREINKIAFNIPIIILTGLQDETIAVKTIAEGAQDYLIKGKFDGNTLARSIRYAVERKHNENVIYEYAEIIQSSHEAIFSLTLDGIIRRWSHTAETIYHYTADEIIGKSFLILISTKDKKSIESLLQAIKSGDSFSQYEINLLDKDGHLVNSLMSIAPIKNKFGSIIGIAVLTQDVTQYKQTEQKLAMQLRLEAALSEASSVYDVTHSILKSICEILEFQIGEIWTIVPEENVIRCASIWKAYSLPGELQQERNQLSFKCNEGIPGNIWASKRPYWTTNLGQDRVMKHGESLLKVGINCCFGFPIIFDEKILGAILLFGKNFEEPDVRFMIQFEIIGKQIGTFFKRQYVEKELLYLTRHDKLTGLANRLVTEGILSDAIEQAKIHQTMVAFLYIDLDQFKNLNDTFGHGNGDIILQEVAQRLKNVTRKIDLVARFSSDEFAIVLPEITTKTYIDSCAQKILDIITLPFTIEKDKFYLTASIGISIYPYDGIDAHSLIKSADLTMYLAKKMGRNSYQYSSLELIEMEQKKVLLGAKLHQALERNEFILYYQPIVNVQTNKLVSVEALLRWKTADGVMVPPAEFIPLLEESDLILAIGEWVLETACKQIKKWHQFGLQNVAINISVHQLNAKFIKKIETTLDKTELSHDLLSLEITESLLMSKTKPILDAIKSLNEMGIYLSIDDFGTGFSSFSYLKNFRINVLKIDQSFITDVHKNKDSASIVNAIIAMAHALNIKTIAEGVETKKQLHFLQKAGCDEYQGYYYSEPLPPDELIKLLKTTFDSNT